MSPRQTDVPWEASWRPWEVAEAGGPGAMVARTHATIGGFLSRCRTVIYRREAARAVLFGIAALGGIGLTLPIAGSLTVETRQGTIALLSSAGLAGFFIVLATLLFGVIAPRRRYGGDREVARWVGAQHRTIASDLLSSVELDAGTTRSELFSPTLIDALRGQIAARLDAIDPRSLTAPRASSHARALALAVLAANVVVAVAAPEAVLHGWKRLAVWPERPFDGAELSAVPLVGDLQITLTAPAYTKRAPTTLASTSGDLRGLPGTAVALRARALVPTAAAELIIDGNDGGPRKRVAATVNDSGQVAAELVLDRAAHYRFAVVSPSGTRVVEAIARTVDIELDQPPVVQLTTPAEPLDVSNVKRVEIGYAIEDDFAVSSAELVWEAGPARRAEATEPRAATGTAPDRSNGGDVRKPNERGRKPLTLGRLPDEALPRVQGKLTWDIAEVSAAAGGEARYWIEAKDNDVVGGPKLGRSPVFHLRVASPRARHEETLDRQQQVATKLLGNLAGRLVGAGDDAAARSELSRQLRDANAELRSVAAAFENDPHTSDLMRKALVAMSERIERFSTAEQRLIHTLAPKDPPHWGTKVGKIKPGAFTASDAKLVSELEDDTVALADWLERERIESLLDLWDEVAAHQRRLTDLLAQHTRTKESRLVAEIDRELQALERGYGELAKRRSAMPEDVLDQYIHRDAAKPEDGASCMSEVAGLARAGHSAAAQAKLGACQQQQQRSAASLEGSLSRVRGDKFSDEQAKLDEVMNELNDVAKDQRDIAAASAELFDRYARKAKELARDHRREAERVTAPLIDKLRKRITSIDETGLTPFAQEEVDIVLRRVSDLEHMVADGDLAEAFDMARQARVSLDTIAGELSSVLSDDPKSKWVGVTQKALDDIRRADSVTKDLVDELSGLAPRPNEIMSDDERRTLDRLRRRQIATQQRGKRLDDRTTQLSSELPGDAAPELTKRLRAATEHMAKATERMKATDPAGSRASTRAAADELAKARDRARSSARQAQISAVDDEPIRIPGADEYKTPARFREELLEAMKRKGAKAPEGYDALIKRYYQDLAK